MRALKPGGQCERILAHLVAGHSLTPMEALRRFGCLRLGGRIHELRRRLHPISTTMIETSDGKTVALYRLPRGARR